ADVIVVAYHEGAPKSQADATYEQQLADSAAFKKMASGTDARALAIFNGHTHQSYAYSTGDGRTVVQAGSFGQMLGKATLSVDPKTG
ncbi:hypothetical protein, partial [Bacillus cereus group sp. Bc237]|uniref:hypothetical protein n=1 Tax=Bacillus cereus group sp. Bc237 TaxID=3018108 RepID=UPI003F22D257